MRGRSSQSGRLGGYHGWRDNLITNRRTDPPLLSVSCCSAVSPHIFWPAYIRSQAQTRGRPPIAVSMFGPTSSHRPPNFQWFHPLVVAGGFLVQLTSEARALSLHGRSRDANLPAGGLGSWHVLGKKRNRFPRAAGTHFDPSACAVRSTHHPFSHVKILITAGGPQHYYFM